MNVQMDRATEDRTILKGRTPAFLADHPIISGTVIGLVWGAVMRAWMRYISEFPEFSWSGTLFILGAAAIAGAVLGLARHRRRMGGAGWWRLSLAALVLLGAGGFVMWPTVILWGVAIGRRRPAWLVWPLVVAGALAQFPVVNDAVLDNWRMTTPEMVTAIAWYTPMLALEAWGFSVVFARGLGGPVPNRVKWVLGVGGLAAAILSTLILLG